MSETNPKRPIAGHSFPPLPDPINYPPGPGCLYEFFWIDDPDPGCPYGRLYLTRGEYWFAAFPDTCNCHDKHESKSPPSVQEKLSPLDEAINVFRNRAYAWGYANSRGDRDESLKLREECKQAELHLRMELEKQYVY